eukprot:1146999-Pelagomonas_calceolata.AAC.13
MTSAFNRDYWTSERSADCLFCVLDGGGTGSGGSLSCNEVPHSSEASKSHPCPDLGPAGGRLPCLAGFSGGDRLKRVHKTRKCH